MKNLSLRKRLVPQLLLILLLLIAFMATYHASVSKTLIRQASEDGTRLCNIFVREMDTMLTDVHRWLGVRFENSTELEDLLSANDQQLSSARQNAANAIAEAIDLYPCVSMTFIWTNQQQEVIGAAGKNVDYDRYQELLGTAKTLKEFGKTFDTDWYAIAAGETCVIVSVVPSGDAMIGVFIEPETLLSAMPFYDSANQHFVLAKHSGYIVSTSVPDGYGKGIDFTGDLSNYYITGERNDVVVCGAQSQVGPFRLMMVTKYQEIQAGLSWTRWILALVIALSVLSVAGVLFSLRRNVLSPLDKATQAIERFGGGQTDTRLTVGREAREFAQIYTAFNAMAEQINHLKIDNYEQVIHKQQAELRFFQTQIKPHFILNCLTTINNLASQNKTEALSKFIADFSGFARCMFKSDYAPVKVSEELKQVEFYIGMQEVRYPGRIFYLPEVSDEAKDALIPAMLIQTLVENSVKHGMDERGQLSIFAKCALEQGLLTISVEDSGCGFSGTALEAINSGSSIGFGLRNLQTTLELLYGGRASLTAKNVPGSGAKVVAVIPQEHAGTAQI